MTEAYEWRNPVFNQFGTIDCEINNPNFGWIPFTANPADVVEEGRLTHAAIIASETLILPYTPPTPEQARAWMQPLTQLQMRVALINRSISTADLDNAIMALPVDKREMARVTFAFSQTFGRLNTSVIDVLNVLGMDAAAIDEFWTVAAA